VSDLDIVLKLDPAAPVAGAKAVTAEVAKTEERAASARAAFDALGKSFGTMADAMKQQTASALTNAAKGFDSLTEAIRREQAVLERIHGPAKKYADDLKTLDSMHERGKLSTKEYADEVARLNKNLDATKPASGDGQLDSIAKNVKSIDFKQAAGAAAQAFELVNQKLQITDSEFGKVAGSAIKFGAMGAQVAGPWGAAAGAVVGALLEIDGVMDDVTETAKRLADSTKTAAERFAELTKDSTTFKGQLVALTTGSHTLTEALILVTRHLQNLHTATAAFDSLGPVLKAVNDQLAAQKKILGDINDPAANFVLSMTALNMLFKNGKISAVDYVEQQSKMATAFATQEGVIVKVAQAYKQLAENQRLVFGKSAILTEPSQRNVEVPQFVPTAQVWDIQPQPGAPTKEEQELRAKIERNIQETRDAAGASYNRHLEKQAEEMKKIAEEAERAKEAIVTMGDVIAGQLIGASKSLSDNLVDAANGADVSWSKWGENMLESLQKAIVQAMILKALTGTVDGSKGVGGYGGILGAIGFASGGTIYPSGGGTADTQSVAFRKRPDETVHINTPQQEAAYQGGRGGGAGRTQVMTVHADDSRALMQSFDGPDGDRVVLNVMRRNPGAVRSLLGR